MKAERVPQPVGVDQPRGRIGAQEERVVERRDLRVARRAARAERGSIAWWYAGMVLDLVHMPLVIGMVLFGATIWRGDTYLWVVSIVVIVQIATLGCPVMALTGWMKRRYDHSLGPE